jgi:hypothetical protein
MNEKDARAKAEALNGQGWRDDARLVELANRLARDGRKMPAAQQGSLRNQIRAIQAAQQARRNQIAAIQAEHGRKVATVAFPERRF